MDNALPQKITTLALGLLRSPSLIVPYVRYLPLWGTTPVSCRQPWISFGALQFLNRRLRRDHEVFEYGGGGSTLYFSERVQSVLTMESHHDWHQKLVAALTAQGAINVVCELHPLSGDRTEQFELDPFFQRVRSQCWDVILIDCYCGYSETRFGQTRAHSLELALPQIKAGGLVILDDSWMFPELLAPRSGWRITDYVGPGPCRYGVTSTAIFEKL